MFHFYTYLKLDHDDLNNSYLEKNLKTKTLSQTSILWFFTLQSKTAGCEANEAAHRHQRHLLTVGPKSVKKKDANKRKVLAEK